MVASPARKKKWWKSNAKRASDGYSVCEAMPSRIASRASSILKYRILRSQRSRHSTFPRVSTPIPNAIFPPPPDVPPAGAGDIPLRIARIPIAVSTTTPSTYTPLTMAGLIIVRNEKKSWADEASRLDPRWRDAWSRFSVFSTPSAGARVRAVSGLSGAETGDCCKVLSSNPSNAGIVAHFGGPRSRTRPSLDISLL
jgi:hypothetical protein